MADPDDKAPGDSDPPALTLGLEKADRIGILLLCSMLVAAVGLFFWFVESLGLLLYPEGALTKAVGAQQFDYFGQALEYRERRLSLALTYRTFITSFGFTVGLVMTTIGGIFVLRRAQVEFRGSVNRGGGGDTATSRLDRAWASVTTNSPGIVFMLGGVAVIVVTQYLAIPVGAPEIFPGQAHVMCTPSQEEDGSCWRTQDAGSGRGPVSSAYPYERMQALCRSSQQGTDKETQEFCKTFNELERTARK